VGRLAGMALLRPVHLVSRSCLHVYGGNALGAWEALGKRVAGSTLWACAGALLLRRPAQTCTAVISTTTACLETLPRAGEAKHEEVIAAVSPVASLPCAQDLRLRAHAAGVPVASLHATWCKQRCLC